MGNIIYLTHPVDAEAGRIYDKLWAIANEHRNNGRPQIADYIEQIAADLYEETRERALRR